MVRSHAVVMIVFMRLMALHVVKKKTLGPSIKELWWRLIIIGCKLIVIVNVD